MADNSAFSFPAFAPPIVDQIQLRQIYLGSNPEIANDPIVQNWKFNNSAWIRLASSINLDIRKDDKGNPVGGAVPLIRTLLPNANPLNYTGDTLAKNFVLSGGVSSVVSRVNEDKSVTFSSQLDAILNSNDYFINSNPTGDLITSTYGFGGLSQGIRPMPGIKSVNVTYLNRGTNARAEVEIIAFNKEQLGLIETLYLHPGYNLLLEWGHVSYIDNRSFEIVQVSDNNTPAFQKLFSGQQFNVGTMANEIYKESLSRSGNYDGMFGPVSNFNYKFNPDGTYTITVHIQSVGLLAESLKLNTSSANGKYQPTVSKALTELQEQFKEKKAEFDKQTEALNKATAEANAARRVANGATRRIVSDKTTTRFSTNTQGDAVSDAQQAQASLDNLQKEIKTLETNIEALRPKETPDNLVSALKFSNILNFWLDIQRSNIDNYLNDNPPSKSDGEKTIVFDVLLPNGNLYVKGFNTHSKNSKFVASSDSEMVSEPQPGKECYIRLGSLLQFISNNLLIYNEDGSVPIFTIDYSLNNNLCTRHNFSVSSDPEICVVSNPNLKLDGNYTPEDKLDNVAPFPTSSGLLGYTMNIFVNLNFAAQASVRYVDVDGNISLYGYLKHLMNGIKAALGYVNDWEVSYDNLSNQITIKELAYSQVGRAISKSPAKFNIYGFDPSSTGDGYGSFVEEVDFNVTLDSKFQANAVVNAQAQGSSVLGEDTTALAAYNTGLIDRTYRRKFSQNLVNTTDEQQKPENFNSTEIAELTRLAIAFYGGSQSVDETKIPLFGNLVTSVGRYLVSHQVKTKKRTPKNVIPFDLSLTIMGLGGIKLRERYTADDKILPPNFATLDFITKAVSHTITGNKWLTKIQSLAVQSSQDIPFVDDTKYNIIVQNVTTSNDAAGRVNRGGTCPSFVPGKGGTPSVLTPGSATLGSLKEAGYIKEANFASFKANAPVKVKFASIIAAQEGYNNTSTLGYKNNNPGNIIGSGNNGTATVTVNRGGVSKQYSYAKYKTKKDGWDALINYYVDGWIINKKILPYAGCTVHPECFKDEDNAYFKKVGIPYKEGINYNYIKGNVPTLRQYISQFCPHNPQDSTQGYIANVYKSLVSFGVDIKSIDEPMTNYIK